MALKNSDIKKQAVVAISAPNGDIKRVLLPHETTVGRPEQPMPFIVHGVMSATAGMTGSLTRLYGGASYLAAGTNVSITSSSNGQVVISAQGASGAPSDATYVTITPNATLSEERVLSAGANITITTSSTGVTISSTGGGSGADDAAQYVVIAATASLANERVLTAGTGLMRTDAGAGGAITLAADGTVARVSGSVFTGNVAVSGTFRALGGMTGSHHFLSDGATAFIAAGQNTSVNTSSAGQIIIAGPLGWSGQTTVQSLTATGGWETIGAFFLSRVLDQIAMETILLVSSASLSGSVRLLNRDTGSVVTGSLLGTNMATDRRFMTANIASNMTAGNIYHIQAECFGGIDIEHYVIVRSAIIA